MKKLLLLATFFLTLSSYCLEQQEDPVTPIFNEIRQEIISANPESPEWDLETFLGSQKAAEFKQKIQPLSQTDKSRLMHDTNNISEKDDTWPLIRDFLALSIKAGGYINTRLRYAQTFLGESVMHSDRSAVEFALEHKADINLKSVYPCPLLYASDYYIAQLLVDEGALEPSKNDNDEQLRLLQRAVRYDRPYQLLELYAKKGLSLKLVDGFNWTLLHILCSYAHLTTPSNFFQKFKILFKAGAVDLDALNNKKETAWDIIKAKSQENKTVQLACALLEGLEKNPNLWEHKLKNTSRNRLPKWLARMQLP